MQIGRLSASGDAIPGQGPVHAPSPGPPPSPGPAPGQRRARSTDLGNEAIERRCHALETKRPLDLDAVAAAIGRIRRPEVLGDRLGDAFRYSQQVEAEVGELSIEVLLPHGRDDYIGRFLHVWTPDERGHAVAQEGLLRALGLPTFEARPGDHVPLHNRVAGRLTRLSANAYDVVSMAYHTIGAMNERLAMGAYARMASIASELGESELARVLLEPMRRDESQHLGYYRTYARQLRQQLRPWQLAAVRALIVHTYAPVGAGSPKDKAPFGRVLLALEDDPENPSIVTTVQQIAEELLARPGQQLPPFVQRSLRACLNRARREELDARTARTG